MQTPSTETPFDEDISLSGIKQILSDLLFGCRTQAGLADLIFYFL